MLSAERLEAIAVELEACVGPGVGVVTVSAEEENEFTVLSGDPAGLVSLAASALRSASGPMQPVTLRAAFAPVTFAGGEYVQIGSVSCDNALRPPLPPTAWQRFYRFLLNAGCLALAILFAYGAIATIAHPVLRVVAAVIVAAIFIAGWIDRRFEVGK